MGGVLCGQPYLYIVHVDLSYLYRVLEPFFLPLCPPQMLNWTGSVKRVVVVRRGLLSLHRELLEIGGSKCSACSTSWQWFARFPLVSELKTKGGFRTLGQSYFLQLLKGKIMNQLKMFTLMMRI